MSKGSKRRPKQITDQEEADNWLRAFGSIWPEQLTKNGKGSTTRLGKKQSKKVAGNE